MRLAQLAEVAERVRATGSRNEKIALLAGLLRSASPDEAELAVAYLSGGLPQGRIGVGPATVRDVLGQSRPGAAGLELSALDSGLSDLAATTGPGSGQRRRALLTSLFAGKPVSERDFLAALVLGELRQGVLEGLMQEAVALATGVPATAIRRALMMAGDLPAVTRAALAGGTAALDAFRIHPLVPLRPMLAQSAADVGEALDRLGEAAFEFKLDGARIQVHKADGEVRIFSRRMNDVTAAVPEVVEHIAGLPSSGLILDGETLALRADGCRYPFQVTMRRFGRRLDIATARRKLPLSAFFFDCLYADTTSLIDRPASERFEVLAANLPSDLLIARQVTSNRTEARGFSSRPATVGTRESWPSP